MSEVVIPIRPQGRVLIVEDEPRMRDLLVRAIGGWGFTVTSARSGEEALRVAETAGPEIALLDLNLPGADGLETLTRLREKRPHLQAIVLTGFASVEAARTAMHLDVVEFLTKPCHLGELEQALDRAMRRLAPASPAAKDEGGDAVATSHSPVPGAEGMTLHDVERQHILAVLERNAGNRTATAVELGISRRTLYYKLEAYQNEGFKLP